MLQHWKICPPQHAVYTILLSVGRRRAVPIVSAAPSQVGSHKASGIDGLLKLHKCHLSHSLCQDECNTACAGFARLLTHDVVCCLGVCAVHLISRALSTQESMASAEGGVNVQPVPLKRASAHAEQMSSDNR